MDRLGGSTRDEILGLLKQQKQLTVMELSEQLGVTEMAVRRHLSRLEKDEVIASTLVRQHVGRPTYVYHLSQKGEDLFPKQYKELLLEMLEDLDGFEGDELVSKLLQARVERTRQHLQKRLINKGTIAARLKEIGLSQEQGGYMAAVETQAEDVFVLTKQNCPFLAVAQRYPVLCKLEESMYQELLPDAAVTTISRAAEGACSCMYKITAKQ